MPYVNIYERAQNRGRKSDIVRAEMLLLIKSERAARDEMKRCDNESAP